MSRLPHTRFVILLIFCLILVVFFKIFYHKSLCNFSHIRRRNPHDDLHHQGGFHLLWLRYVFWLGIKGQIFERAFCSGSAASSGPCLSSSASQKFPPTLPNSRSSSKLPLPFLSPSFSPSSLLLLACSISSSLIGKLSLLFSCRLLASILK